MKPFSYMSPVYLGVFMECNDHHATLQNAKSKLPDRHMNTNFAVYLFGHWVEDKIHRGFFQVCFRPVKVQCLNVNESSPLAKVQKCKHSSHSSHPSRQASRIPIQKYPLSLRAKGKFISFFSQFVSSWRPSNSPSTLGKCQHCKIRDSRYEIPFK